MPSTQEFRRRIKSVNNTKQITKAMQMIASIKMQKAVRTISAARSYIQNSWNTLAMLAEITSPENHPLLQARPVKKVGLILITSDRGLCGSYNTNILNKALAFARGDIKLGVTVAPNVISSEHKRVERSYEISPPRRGESRNDTLNIDLVAVGQKAAGYAKKIKNGTMVAEFTGLGREIQFEETTPITKLAIDSYISGEFDQVVVIYSHFESALKQTPVVKQVLPITKEHIDMPELWESDVKDRREPNHRIGSRDDENGVIASEAKQSIEFKFEPNPDAVLEGILSQFIRMQVYGAILEANASEHSARMFAMQNATDNATDLIDELQLIYNSVRQGNITREIAEISGAAEAMK